MKILEINVLRGPNYWSNFRNKLILFKIDLEEFEAYPTNLIPNFNTALTTLIPSLATHYCSYNTKGGFIKRLEEGTWLGHVMEHVALELQTLAGMDCGFGRTYRTNKKGIYEVAFSYIYESAGVYAGKIAFNIVTSLAEQLAHNTLADEIKKLQNILHDEKFGPSTEAILKEAERRNIPINRLDHHSLVMLGYGRNQKIIRATLCDTDSIGVDIACDKQLTKIILKTGFVPTPIGHIVNSLKTLEDALSKIDFPCVIKPNSANHGRGITTNITSKEQAFFAFERAKKISKNVIVEKYIKGNDYRLLVVDFKFVAAGLRIPAHIIGDGISSIKQLIEKVNTDSKRGKGHENILTTIKIDESTKAILQQHNFSLSSILSPGQVLYLKHAANISSGGTAVDVTDLIHPANIKLAERVARLCYLNICGIDMIAEDINIPINYFNGAVIEVNAAPGLRMHLEPSVGTKRNVAKPILDMLFPQGKSARIPIIAITGTNGKTTVVRLIAHIAQLVGHIVGYTTTEGVYINKHLVFPGDCSGPESALVVFRDSLVDFAVLECARGGILRAGLAFDQCDLSIVTNVSEDHLGLNEIDTLSDLADVKSVVPRSTKKEGYAILNADDELTYKMKDVVISKIALFAMSKQERILKHCEQGGMACYLDVDYINLQSGENILFKIHVKDIPVTFSGHSNCMIQNVLPVILACFISNFSVLDIEAGLKSFLPLPQYLPGRMNIFNFDHFSVMVDYAHNENAFIELQDYLKTIKADYKIGIIAATGDRREIDIIKVGYYAAHMFDEIIIRHDLDSRGRSNETLTDLIVRGIKQVTNKNIYKIISDEQAALKYALLNKKNNCFIFYFPEKILPALALLEKMEKDYKKSAIGKITIADSV